MDRIIQKITTNLWFDMNAEEAVDFYTSVFNNSQIGRVTYYSGVGSEKHSFNAGKVMTIEFQIEGQDFIALNGSPAFQYTEAISFIINCESQEEVDYYWGKLAQGSDEKKKQMCGWLTDRFGITWQVIPVELNQMLFTGEAKKVERLTNALLKMKKLDLNELRRAYE
ncbi:VOC family protein [Planococcus donghaensis]|uniref:PhnB-like domain-containing protein n=1 Tax=Planococcus donghaensis TaxID=414778 RepID=A0A1C7EIZ4_9BACL|nr:VOC family protein [Planococcus donghaensis]ANU23944.1 hypothetical protein BCM40_11445 [Planococcus donghaensis]